MGYRTLRQCVEDLAATGQLAVVEAPIDAELEAAEIQRRVFPRAGRRFISPESGAANSRC